MINKKMQKCLELMRQLVTDIQGAPYPGDEFGPELYKIWYEHAQRVAVDCFEFLEENYPVDRVDFERSITSMLE